MTDDKQKAAPEQSQSSIIRKLGIAGSTGLDGSISLCRQHDGTFEIRINAKDDGLLSALKEAIEAAKNAVKDNGAPEVPGDEKTDRVWSGLKDLLIAAGHNVLDLPPADQQITFQIDLMTGRTVGTTTALHPRVRGGTDIARNILQSVRNSLREMPTQCAREVRAALTNGNLEDAVSALRKYDGQGVFHFPPTLDLFDALFDVDVSQLSSADRRFIRERKLLVSGNLKRYSLHAEEARLLLEEYASELDAQWIQTLRMAQGIGQLHAGHPEAAMAIWRDIANSPEALSAGNRAWLYRNMSLAMNPRDPETQIAAKRSSDAFLELGEKDNAVGSLMMAIQCSLFESPESAIALLTETIGWFPDDSLNSEDRRAWLLISRGKHYLRLRHFSEALKDAEQAIALRSKHVGQESNLIAALHLAAIASNCMGSTDTSRLFKQRADQITEQTGSVHFQLAQEIVELFQTFDSGRAADIHKRAVAAGEYEIAAAVQLAITQFDASFDVPSRLARLSDVVAELQTREANHEMLEPARMAMVVQLRAAGDERGAARWCETILAENPLNEFAERSFLQACRVLSSHDKAIDHLQAQNRRLGPAPNRLLYLARFLIAAGRASDAVEPLCKIRAHPDWPESVRKQADSILLEVLDIPETPLRPPRGAPTETPVLREEIEHALQRFATTVEAHVRHSFWRPANGSKQWAEKPERLAQDFLKLFLKAIFQARLDIYEEVAAGAGRIDLALAFAGGLSVILELKMCGVSYSSTYAFSGSDQILHYMKNLQKSLGYLLIFDARVRDFGKGVDPVTALSNFTVVTNFIDVRPSIR